VFYDLSLAKSMKPLLCAFLFSIFSIPATGQVSGTKTAVSAGAAYFELRMEGAGGKKAYLVKDQFLTQPSYVADSVLADSSGTARFRFDANPNSWYQVNLVQTGLSPVISGYCFSRGDSVIAVKSRKSRRPTILYDRIGAFTEEVKLFKEQDSLWNALNDTSCEAVSALLSNSSKYSKLFQTASEKFRSHYPEHVYVVNYLRRFSRIAGTLIPAVLSYSQERSGRKCGKYLDAWLDTISFDYSEDGLDPLEIAITAESILNARYERLKHADSSVSRDGGITTKFNLASQMKGYVRDLAYIVVAGYSSQATPDIIVSYIDRMIDTIRLRDEVTKTIPSLERLRMLAQHRLSGIAVPDFNLPDTENVLHDLKPFRGKAVLLHFWGTWCGPCLTELPKIQKIEQAHDNDTNLVCISIAFENHNFVKWKNFLREHKLNDIELYSEGIMGNGTEDSFGVEAFPSEEILDRHGKIVRAITGSITSAEDIEKYIEIAEKE
jgi:thiol-disulfide isomerase/thioredoxin